MFLADVDKKAKIFLISPDGIEILSFLKKIKRTKGQF
jgi:hypothetical protein